MLKHDAQRIEFISEAFHTLYQPLTSLHCSLELALQKERTPAEYKKRVQESLSCAQRVLGLVGAVRELVDADDPGQGVTDFSIRPVLRRVIDEFDAVAASRQQSVSCDSDADFWLHADESHLTQALLRLLNYVSLSSGVTNLVITTQQRYEEAEIIIHSTPAEAAVISDLKLARIQLATAFRSIGVIGGRIEELALGFRIILPKAVSRNTTSTSQDLLTTPSKRE